MIELRNFTKIYNSQKDNPAVENVSFVCESDSITGIVGENGSGKSTIIKAITGIHYATSGNVFLKNKDGQLIDPAENIETIKRIVGYVPENPVLPQDIKVIDFLNYAASLFYDIKSDEIVLRAIKKCTLENVSNKKIKTLSKGFKQRVSFAQSILADHSILVLDEPFSGLDPAQVIQMRNLIIEESKNKTVLISTHNLSEVHNLCKKIIVMKNGKLTASGTEESLKRDTASKTLEEAFLKL